MLKYILQVAILFFLIMSQPQVTLAEEKNNRIMAEIFDLGKLIVLNKKYVLKSLPPEETGLSEEYLRRLVNETEAALLTVSNFKILLQNRYATEEIWSEAIEFGDANFDEIYNASKADFLILVSPRILANDVELNIQIMELIGQNAGRVIGSTGYFNLAINLDETIGVNYDFLAEKVQIEIKKELKDIDQQIALIDYLRNEVSNDVSLDKRLVKLIQDKKAFLIDVNRTYKAKIAPGNQSDIGLAEAVFIPLKVPYFASQIGQTYHDALPSAASLTEGYLKLAPGIDEYGKFELSLSFTQQPKGIVANDINLNLSEQEIRDLASAIKAMAGWEDIAREKKLNRMYSKTALCTPQPDACFTGFIFVIFETNEGPEFSRVIEFSRGNAKYSYSFEASIFEIVGKYLQFLNKQGISEFIKQVTDDGGLVQMFE